MMIRVLRGANPATMPFVLASKHQLVVDLDAAQAYGVTVPAAVMNRADSCPAPHLEQLVLAATTDIRAIPDQTREARKQSIEFWLVAISQGAFCIATPRGACICRHAFCALPTSLPTEASRSAQRLRHR